jgi:2Fe-2S type ferredoxin
MAQVFVTRDGMEEEFSCDPQDIILEAAQEEGVDIPFGCTSGNCHMCLCQIIEGEVVRADLDSLNKKQREEGFILTCQSRPKSEVLKIEIKG